MQKPVNKIWTTLDILKWTQEYFFQHTIDDARLEAEMLLSHVLGVERIQLYVQHDKPIQDTERKQIREMIKKRIAGEPIQYIIGEAYFFGNRFSVNQNVLIPRPETEIMVEKALDLINKNNFSKIFDIGTGSGAIVLTLAKCNKNIFLYASDISDVALDVACENAAHFKIADRISFRKGNLLEPWISSLNNQDTILILANLPYVRRKEWDNLEKKVKQFEPKNALVAGEEGLDCYEELIHQLKEVNCSYTVICELGINQMNMLAEKVSAVLHLNSECIRDLDKKERFIIFSSKNVSKGSTA